MKMSKTARARFLHAEDTNDDTGQREAYFCQHGYGHTNEAHGWGMWISRDGEVTIDEETANGESPSARVIATCRVAAKRILKTDNKLTGE